METSAKTAQNVENAFMSVARYVNTLWFCYAKSGNKTYSMFAI